MKLRNSEIINWFSTAQRDKQRNFRGFNVFRTIARVDGARRRELQTRANFETLPTMNSATDPVAGSQAEFYQAHLDRVSRSFAFCIARLEGALRVRVGLSYLLCRMLDTIEDAEWPHFELQEQAFARFDRFVARSADSGEVDAWIASFPTGLPEGETLLLLDAGRVFADFHALPTELRESLGRSILSMSAGMRHYMGQKARHGRLVLESAADVNRYCFFVAGVVGEMLTRFMAREVQPSLARLRDGFRFGLFLQKVNILKDQSGDEAVGRYLVPSRSLVLSGLLRDADGAFRYLLSLPEKDVGFRLFCAWSLFLGLASLPFIQGLHGEKLKIPREDTLSLLCEVESRIHDDAALQTLFDELRPSGEALADGLETREMAPMAMADATEQSLLALYQGDLPATDVLALFSAREI